jgi:3-phosphoshikimate 1-carboxyvinyltransferase
LSSLCPEPLIARPSGPLTGRVRVPGDKSISHRALILGASAVGETTVEGLLEAEDVLASAEALRAMGAEIDRDADGIWRICGPGVGGLRTPDSPLDLGNSGTGVRLLMGLVATQPITVTFTGDASLRRRPMARVLEPLRRMGARCEAQSGDRLPITIHGAQDPLPIDYRLPVASAQVKSAILLAGLNTPGRTGVIEAKPTRDHTERMAIGFGAEIAVADLDDGARHISITGHPELRPQALHVPADPSSAAFAMVAALITDGSDITIENVMINPTRNGLITSLQEMGGAIELIEPREIGGETIADLRVCSGRLEGITVPPERAPSMIDEYPVLAVAAACAGGATRMRGLEELRVKESDRLAAVAAGLAACGANCEIEGDDLIVHGGPVPGGGPVETEMDHRIAMAFLVLGLASDQGVSVDDGAMIATSFPDFTGLMAALGADMGPVA